MPTPAYQNKLVVITGGSSGIGLALARELSAQCARLVLIAKNMDKLIAAKSMLEEGGVNPVHILAADVSDKAEITEAIKGVGEKYGSIDLLINCAGMITCGRFADQPASDLEKCMSVNYLGSLYAAKAAWPYLKTARGQLSFVSSVAGYMGLIGYSSYAPTKFALAGLAECLRMEGKDDGIRVSIIYPPDTDTPLLHYEHEHTIPDCRALSRTIKAQTAQAVARKYLDGLSKDKFEIYCDTNSRLVRWLKNNFPTLSYYITWNIVYKARRQNARTSLRAGIAEAL